MGYTLTTPPASEPVTATNVKTHARVDTTADDTLIATFISAARREVENYTASGIVSQVWTLTLPSFPIAGNVIVLPRGPVLSVNSMSYLDANGDEQTVDADLIVLTQTPLAAELSLVAGEAWPATAAQRNAVTIVFTVGYADNSKELEIIKAAIYLRVADLYRNREAQQGTQLFENKTICSLLDGLVRAPLQ